MKIAIITQGHLPVPNVKGGGVETLITSLLKKNEIYKKFDITLFSIADNEAKKQSELYNKTKIVYSEYQERTLFDRIRCRLTKDFPLETPYSFTKVDKMLAKGNFDIILIENSPWQFPYFVKKYGEKVMLHLHNDWIHNDWEEPYRSRLKEAINNSGGVLAVSKFLKDRILTIEGVDSEKIQVYYNATDIELYSKELPMEEREELRKKYGVDKDDILVLYTGRVCKDKGVLEMAQAFEKIASKHQNVKLMIVGSIDYGETTYDEYTEQVKMTIDRYENQAVVTGFINYREMYKYYAIADIQVIPSVWEEPFGLVAIEGMSQGLAIVSTNSGGLPEILDNDSAVIISKKTIVDELVVALDRLIIDREYRETIGKNAYQKVSTAEEFNLEGYYKAFVNFIKQRGR